MILIGITGGIGHGKSVLAEDFARIETNSIHLETSAVIALVADGMHSRMRTLPSPHELDQINEWLECLPEVLMQTLGRQVSYDRLRVTTTDISAHPELYEKLFVHLEKLAEHPDMYQTRITASNKGEYRAILQWLGGYLVAKVDPDIWYQELIRQASEAEAHGAKLCIIGGVRFVSDANVIHGANGRIIHIMRPLLSEPDKMDPTERERVKIEADITIVNDASLLELLVCAQHIYTDIQLGRLKHRYVTSEIDTKKLVTLD